MEPQYLKLLRKRSCPGERQGWGPFSHLLAFCLASSSWPSNNLSDVLKLWEKRLQFTGVNNNTFLRNHWSLSMNYFSIFDMSKLECQLFRKFVSVHLKIIVLLCKLESGRIKSQSFFATFIKDWVNIKKWCNLKGKFHTPPPIATTLTEAGVTLFEHLLPAKRPAVGIILSNLNLPTTVGDRGYSCFTNNENLTRSDKETYLKPHS